MKTPRLSRRPVCVIAVSGLVGSVLALAHAFQLLTSAEKQQLPQETLGTAVVERIRKTFEDRGIDPRNVCWDTLGFVDTNLAWQKLVPGQLDGITFEGQLVLVGVSGIRDLSAVNGERLSYINTSHSSVTRLPNFRGATMVEVVAVCSDLESLDGLQGASIESLYIGGTKVTKLSPLQHCQVSDLQITDTAVRDLTFLNAMTNLYSLAAAQTQIRDLAPIGKAALRFLDISKTKVANIEDLNLSMLEELSIVDTCVTNIDCLAGSQVQRLNINVETVPNSVDIMAQMTNLCWVNSVQIRDTDTRKLLGHDIRTILTAAGALSGSTER